MGAIAAIKSLFTFAHRKTGLLRANPAGAVTDPKVKDALAERILSEAVVQVMMHLEPDPATLMASPGLLPLAVLARTDAPTSLLQQVADKSGAAAPSTNRIFTYSPLRVSLMLLLGSAQDRTRLTVNRNLSRRLLTAVGTGE